MTDAELCSLSQRINLKYALTPRKVSTTRPDIKIDHA